MISTLRSLAHRRNVSHLVGAPGPPTELTFWLLAPADLLEAADASFAERWLDTNERSRLTKMRFDRDRRAMLASYALRRSALADLLGASPDTIQFTRDNLGRTFVQPLDSPRLWTSLSRRTHMVGFVSSGLGPIGIDIETIDPTNQDIELLEPFLDSRSLRQIAEDLRSDAAAFAMAWTLIEAFAKAKGGGLSEVSDLQFERAGGDRFRVWDSTLHFNAIVLTPDRGHVASIVWP